MQETRRTEATEAASRLTSALVDHLNVGVAQAYLNQVHCDWPSDSVRPLDCLMTENEDAENDCNKFVISAVLIVPRKTPSRSAWTRRRSSCTRTPPTLRGRRSSGSASLTTSTARSRSSATSTAGPGNLLHSKIHQAKCL